MKRDLDLARQLLLDIENRGADCSMSVLRSGPDHELQERIRYHLRLLIDANLLQEVDRTSSGIPCVRLTHDGHELLELARSESRWVEAKSVCQDRIGGLSLSLIRKVLLKLAVTRYRVRRPYLSRRYRYEPENYRGTLNYRDLDRIEDRSYVVDDDVRYVRVRGGYDSLRDGIDLDGDGVADLEFDPPVYSDLI